MQSYRSQQALTGFLRNPSILAMIVSAGIHGVFVLFTALNPAESLPNAPLQVISLDPGSSTTNLNGLLPSNSLPVPNGLPPINIGDVPELSALPSLSGLGKSQSVYLGSDPSTLNFGKLSIRNPPQKSAAGAQTPVFGLNLPKTPSGPPQRLISSPFSGTFSGNRSLVDKIQTQQDRAKYAINPNQTPPNLNPGPILPSGDTSFTEPLPTSFPTPIASPNLTSPNPSAITGSSAAPVREKYTGWLQAKSQAYGQQISTQTGPRLTAEYPQSACNTKVEGSALIAAVFGPNGSLAPGTDSIQVIQSAETLALTRAAIATVEGYRFASPSGIHQAYNFKVDVPYSAAACTAGSSPEPSVKPSPSPAITPTQPSDIPSPAAPKATSKEEFLKRLESSSLQLERPQVERSQVKSSQAPSPSLTPSPEPLPTASIVVPEEMQKSP
jgi:hypothetical protein